MFTCEMTSILNNISTFADCIYAYNSDKYDTENGIGVIGVIDS